MLYMKNGVMNESRYHDDCQMLPGHRTAPPTKQINFSSQMSTVLNLRNPDLEIVAQNVYILSSSRIKHLGRRIYIAVITIKIH